MKKRTIFGVLGTMLLLAGAALGQTTTTTATVADSDGTAWANGTYSIQYYNVTPGKPYNTSTGAFITTSYTGTLNSSGALSVTLDDVKYVNPANGTWVFTVCPDVSGGSGNCGTTSIPVSGASEDVSSQINAVIRAPRPGGGVGAYGYADVEFQAIPNNSYYNVTTAACRLYTSSWGGCGGGGSAPAAPYQSPQINAQGSFGPETNVYVGWSGDTAASLETLCAANPTTYELSIPLTLTLTGNTAISCNVDFRGNGEFVNNTAYALTINGKVTGPPSQHFGGTGTGGFVLGPSNNLVPVEWFGAVGDGSTNNLAALQAAINATTYGQVELEAGGIYNIAGTLTYTKSNVGMTCSSQTPRGNYNPSTAAYACSIMETVAGDDAIDVHGTSSTYVDFGVFNYFNIGSTVTQTGTSAGFSSSFTGGLLSQYMLVQEFFYPFYIHASPSFSSGGFYHDTAEWTSLSSGLTSPIGFYLPSTDGYAENSLTIRDSGVSRGGGPASCIGMLLYGTAVNDVNTYNFGVAGCADGQDINYTGTATNYGASDDHFISTTVDSNTRYGMYFQATSTADATAGRATVTVIDPRISNDDSTYGITASQYSGIVVTGGQITVGASQAGIRMYYVDDATFTSNFISGTSAGNTTNGILGNNLTHVAISGNHLGYQLTNGINLDSGSGYITGLDTNAFDASLTVAHQVVNASVNSPGSYTTQTVVNCSTSGTVTFSQPQIGPSYKRVNAYFAACLGTFSYTYPTAFSFAPQLLSQSITATVVTSISNTAVSGTGTTTTGFADLDGY